MRTSWTVIALLLCAPAPVYAEEFVVDPEHGSMSNPGSIDKPWSTLEAVIAAGLFGTTIRPGDTVWLRSGYHGDAQFKSGDFDPPIEVRGEGGYEAHLKRIRVSGASGLTFANLWISPSYADDYETVNIVEIGRNSSRIELDDSALFSEDDASGWGADEWVNRASSAIEVSGDDAIIRRNLVRNVRFGISVSGQRALIDHNTIDGFSADGLRGLGDDGVFQYNVVKNVYVDDSQDDNHDDGFQSWSVGSDGMVGTGEVRGVILRGNLILNYEDANQPLRASLQGVGCFDGTFVDWVIENNVVITDHWHGITLLGARNCRIVNNTVLDLNDQDPGPPRISIDKHKDGTAPEGCLVRNNLATDYADADTGVTEDHNFTITDPAALFADVAKHDLHLRAGASQAIDQGSADQAPELDADGIMRPQGSAVDLGAFESHAADIEPIANGMGGDVGPSQGAGGIEGGGTGGMSGMAGTSGGNAASGSGGSGTIGKAGSNGNAATGAAARGGEGARGGNGTAGGAGGARSDGGQDAGSENGSSGSASDGCSCRIAQRGGARSTNAWLLLAAFALTVRRRRRSAHAAGGGSSSGSSDEPPCSSVGAMASTSLHSGR